ncbi:hypothetical protein NDU88_006537 [Pleurodeles waltl]|uniref:Uncharacterized protein n=1 Tax=Pleurodeles waltl TaxID=8319 RepID=A0AAV7QM85_PLEWA|nr:hypothetical protein NDU88_006537 [Pleurodeles waltl]
MNKWKKTQKGRRSRKKDGSTDEGKGRGQQEEKGGWTESNKDREERKGWCTECGKKGKPKRSKKKTRVRQKKRKKEPETKEGKSKDQKKTKEEQSEDEKQMGGEQHQDIKETARADRRKKMRSKKSGSKQDSAREARAPAMVQENHGTRGE